MASGTESRVVAVLRVLLVLVLVGQGINHFVMHDEFVRMIPPWLPAPSALVVVSGIAEIVLGLLVLPERTRRPAGFGILALFVAIFPANLEMALHPESWPEIPPAALWARLPLQGLLLAWAWLVCLRRPSLSRGA